MTESEYLYCALNLMLDEEEEIARLCPSCRSLSEMPHCPACGVAMPERWLGENESFDMARFEALAGGERPW